MDKTTERVQICDCHEFTSLDNLEILISYKKPILPEDIEKKVKNNWNQFRKINSNAKDNQVAYLVSYNSEDVKTKLDVFLAGFMYNQFLNRSNEGIKYSYFNYNPLESWIMLVCNHGKHIIFGNKINYGSRVVSGFGGSTNSKDKVNERIDPKKWVQRKLKEEIGKENLKKVIEICDIGLNFYPVVSPRSYNKIFVANLDGKPKDVQKEFRESLQFSKQLIPVNANPKALLTFLESKVWEPTWPCIGGVINYIGSRWGLNELENVLSSYPKKDMIKIFGD